MRHYPADVVFSDDLLKRTEKDFELKRWLEGDPDRHVSISEIWHRLRCGRKDLGNLQNALIALVVHESAVVAARGLVRAFIIMQLIGFYSESAFADFLLPDSFRLVHHFELENEDILSVAEFARIDSNWNFLL